VAQYTRKGALVYVEGRIQTRSWEGQDGQKRRVTEIIANDVQFLEPRGAGSGGGVATPARAAGGAPHDDIPAPDDAPRDVDPDEIPF
jgi:single-strand DNA-binding protein